MFDGFAHVRETKKLLFGNGSWSDASHSFIDCHRLVPNGPHESNFLPNPEWVPNLRLVKYIIIKKIALPLICHACGSQVPVNNQMPTKLGGVIEEQRSINPLPPIRVPIKCGNFTIEENDFLHFSFLFLTFSGMNDFNLMKKTYLLSR